MMRVAPTELSPKYLGTKSQYTSHILVILVNLITMSEIYIIRISIKLCLILSYIYGSWVPVTSAVPSNVLIRI